MLHALPAAADPAGLRLPESVSTFTDGRRPIDALYQMYLSLLERGWMLEIVVESRPEGTTQALPIIALHTPAKRPAVWILSAIHGEEGLEIQTAISVKGRTPGRVH